MNPLSMSSLVAASAFAFIHEFDYLQPPLKLSCFFFSASLLVTLATIFHYLKRQASKVYLVEFACYKPDDSYAVPKETFMTIEEKGFNLQDQSLKVAKKILDKSGMGHKMSLHKALLEIPPNTSLVEARKEAEAVFFGAIDELVEKTQSNPKIYEFLL